MAKLERPHFFKVRSGKITVWKDLEYRLHYRLPKFDGSVFLNLKLISYFFGFDMAWFLSRNYEVN